MDPEVRHYADPLEGLEAQLNVLLGLIRKVPPLIDADRDRRWQEISSRPSDGEDGDVIDIYGEEAGPEEDGGFADYAHMIRVSAIVFAWAIFHDFLVHQLKRSFFNLDLSAYPELELLVDDDVRSWERQFGRLSNRYREIAGIKLSDLPSWHEVLHAQALRNALVHNQGQYTRAYLETKLAHFPTSEDLLGFPPPADPALLIDREQIPLSLEQTEIVLGQLRTAATETREAIDLRESERSHRE